MAFMPSHTDVSRVLEYPPLRDVEPSCENVTAIYSISFSFYFDINIYSNLKCAKNIQLKGYVLITPDGSDVYVLLIDSY